MSEPDEKVGLFLEAGALGAAASVLLCEPRDNYAVINCIA